MDEKQNSAAMRLSKLQEYMDEYGIDAYIVCTEDFHGSEYVGSYFKAREYLTGFTGSAGTLLVFGKALCREGKPEAALWTDGRYFLQAEAELKGSKIQLMKSNEEGVPGIEEFLADCGRQLNSSSGGRVCQRRKMVVGFDGRTVSGDFVRKIEKAFQTASLEGMLKIIYEQDLADKVWKDRPPLSAEPVWELDVKYTGLTRGEKLKKVRERMAEYSADCFVISGLDDLAWLLNLRGNDVKCSPVFLSYMLLYREQGTLYINEGIIGEDIKKSLEADGIFLKPYHQIYRDLQNLAEGSRLLLDTKKVNYMILQSPGSRVEKIDAENPITLLKAVKTRIEYENVRQAHIKDGIAVTRFMYWLKTSMAEGIRITELSAGEKLEGFRREQEGYLGPSFEPIMAYGEHGAIVHYSATEDSNAVLEPRSFLLADTGGHYYEGTTDVTRTYGLGELTPEEKKIYTLVLAGHLELANASFPHGVRGVQLDILAREPLWRWGLDFNHGTGHGVGYLLNVHEGPNAFRYRIPNIKPAHGESWRGVSSSDYGAVLEEGMITSNEPGIYMEGSFGVRLENLILCRGRDGLSAEKHFLGFENLTMTPFDLDAIDKQYLTDREFIMLNQYHARVYEVISPYLPEQERIWLKEATAEIK